MDPNVTWTDLVAAIADGDWESAMQLATDLADWMGKAGFPPNTGAGDRLPADWHRSVASAACTFVLSRADPELPFVQRAWNDLVVAYRAEYWPIVERVSITLYDWLLKGHEPPDTGVEAKWTASQNAEAARAFCLHAYASAATQLDAERSPQTDESDR